MRHTRSSIDEELDAYESHRFENLAASRLDCCGRCDIEEDIANTELGGHVDANTECERTGGLSAVDGSPVLQRS